MKARHLLIFFSLFVLLLGVEARTEACAQQGGVTISSLSTVKDGKRYIVHKTKRREKLEDIAATYGVTIEDIYRANPSIYLDKKVKKNTTLLIPILEPEPQKEEGKEEIAPPQVDTVVVDTLPREVLFGLTAPIRVGAPLRVALLLPFSRGGNHQGFVEFYNGVRLALDELEKRGARVELDVISTDRSVERANEIISSGELDNVNMIIGPIYEGEFAVMADYAAQRRIPIISPLGSTGEVDNPFVVGVSPEGAAKWEHFYDKIASAQNNVVVIRHSSKSDAEMTSALLSHCPSAHQVGYIDKTTNINDIASVLSRSTNNVIIVPINDEIVVEEILSRLSSLNSMGRYDIEVIGNSSWARFTKLGLDLFFKLEVSIPSSYFYDHLSEEVIPIHAAYISKYSGEPTLYSMRGYDVGALFVGLLYEFGDEVMYSIRAYDSAPLQTPYSFTQRTANGKLLNERWATVHYHPNYTITVE